MSSPSTSELRRAARKCCTTMRRGWAPRPGARLLLHRACVGNRGNVVRLVASATASAPLRPQLGSERPRAADAPSDEAHLAATPAPASAPPGHQHTAGPSPGDMPPQLQHAPHARGPAVAAPRPPPPHTRSPGPPATISIGDGASLSAADADADADAAAARRHTIPTAHTGPVPTAGTLGLPALPAELPGGGGGGASGAGAAAAVAAAAGSHTEPANARLSAHGCYRVLGPAVIRRRGDTLIARLLPGARLELMEADGAAAAMRPAFQAPATASAGAAAAAASRGSVSRCSIDSIGSSGSMDGPVDLASLGLVICNSPGGGGGGGGGASRDESGLGVELPLRRCLVAPAAGDSLDGEDDNAAEMDLYGNGNGSSCGCVMVAAGASAPAVALKQQRQPRQQARSNESSKEVWEATEAEEAPAGDVTQPRYRAAATAGWGGARAAPAPLLLPLPAACHHHPPPRPYAQCHQAAQQEQQAVGVGGEEGAVGGEEGGGDAAAGWGLLTAGCEDDEDDGAVAECVLVAAHVELGGSACSVDQLDAALHPAVTRHNGRTYVAVRRLPPHAVITLHADGDLSHPVNVTPPPPPPQPQ